GKVETIVQATGEGQFSPSGKLMSAADIGSKGKLAVRFTLDDEEVANSLPMGTSGSVAIYTGFGKPFQIISKIGMRIKTWMYYIAAI
ncbi:MAG: HlyD family secretion protein, partial [Rubripirellula sp.]